MNLGKVKKLKQSGRYIQYFIYIHPACVLNMMIIQQGKGKNVCSWMRQISLPISQILDEEGRLATLDKGSEFLMMKVIDLRFWLTPVFIR